MLVCNVSLRPPRTAIIAELAEVAAAVDGLTTGFVIFATLVDDPASVRETVDAYLGEIMLEAASASDVVTSGSAYLAAVDAAVTAVDLPDASVTAAAIARSAMLPSAIVNSSGTSRDGNVDGTIINL